MSREREPKELLLSSKALFRDPRGFEGRGTIIEVAHANDLSVAQREEVESREAHLGSAAAPTTHLGAYDQDVITVIEDLSGLESVRLPGTEPQSEAALDCVAPAVDLLADRDSGRGVPLDIAELLEG